MKKKKSTYAMLILACVFLVNTLNASCNKHPNQFDEREKEKTGSVSNLQNAPVLPLATGTFWQLGISRLNDWSDEKLAAEVALVKQAGMDVIMIHYGAVWNADKNRYHTYIPNAGFSPFSNLGNRDPLGAIFAAAEKLQVKVILGDFLVPPNLRYDHPKEAFKQWLSPKAMEFRSAVINRYKKSPSFYGYYIPNEPNPYRIKTQKDKDSFFSGTKEVIKYVKSLYPSLKVIHSIGLYPEWKTGNDGVAKPYAPSAAYLESFWGRWINELDQVDTWMMIDGIGTKLASLRSTETAQAWGKEAVHRAGKEFWVDVENAVMGSKYYSFAIGELVSSLDVAVKYADKIVLFEHLSYMTPNNNKPTAKQLYEDYLKYRKGVLKR